MRAWRPIAVLLILWSAASLRAFTLLTYNVAGNGTTDWSTNAPQVRAIGRQMMFLQPDIITFNEVPFTNSYQMTNFVLAFLPGYYLARNSGTDGFLRSVIMSRFPITRSDKWLDGVSLLPFGVDARFARDLFEAEIQVPDFKQPLHVFTTHLKSLSDAESAARRGAEASAVSNYFATVFLPTKGTRPYVLTGDLNEDVNHPPSSTHQPLQRLVNTATGLRLTAPVNPATGSERTISIRASLTARFDYILPCSSLFSNLLGAQVFRTDTLSPTPAGLEKLDDKTASDHLPVIMEFRNPYEPPLQITSIKAGQGMITIRWPGRAGRRYDLETSASFASWSNLVRGLSGGDREQEWTFIPTAPIRFIRLKEMGSF